MAQACFIATDDILSSASGTRPVCMSRLFRRSLALIPAVIIVRVSGRHGDCSFRVETV